jgi:hypothetical protein
VREVKKQDGPILVTQWSSEGAPAARVPSIGHSASAGATVAAQLKSGNSARNEPVQETADNGTFNNRRFDK